MDSTVQTLLEDGLDFGLRRRCALCIHPRLICSFKMSILVKTVVPRRCSMRGFAISGVVFFLLVSTQSTTAQTSSGLLGNGPLPCLSTSSTFGSTSVSSGAVPPLPLPPPINASAGRYSWTPSTGYSWTQNTPGAGLGINPGQGINQSSGINPGEAIISNTGVSNTGVSNAGAMASSSSAGGAAALGSGYNPGSTPSPSIGPRVAFNGAVSGNPC